MGNRADQTDEVKYRLLFDRIADPVVIFDKTTHRILDWNPAFLRVYGYTPRELKKMTPLDLHPDQETERVQTTINIRNIDHTYQYTHLTKHGRRMIVEILSDELEYQGRPAWISIIRDITQRKKAEDELRKLSRAVEQSPTSVVITDTDGRIQYVNPKFTQLTGYSAEDAIGENPRILKSDENSPELYRDLWETITRGKEWRGELCNRKKNGELFWESASISPIRDGDGQITHFIGVKEDITERKKTEADLRRAKETAEQATRAKSQFLANMSHEIRTPLNAIIGMSELAQELSSSDELKTYLSVIQRSSESLLSLVEDILDFSKIETGQMEVESTEFDLHNLIENIAELFGMRADNKGVELLCYVDPGVPRYVRGDPNKIRQILINLVGNAIKFTEKGEVSLKVLKRNESEAKAKAPPLVDLDFVISDTGVGISKKNIEKVFQSFSQEDSSIKRKFGGTGLGLSISKSLIELMGGELDLVSKRGEGSIFTVRLSLSPGRNPKSNERPVLKDYSVLIVDDNETNRFILRTMLSNWGLDVSEAATGREALSFLEQTKSIDLMLVDQHMPEMDGVTLVRKIREHPQYRTTKVVMLSSTASCELDLKEELNITEFICKPVKQSRLKDVLRDALQLAHDPVENRPGENQCQVRSRKILLVEDNLDNQRLAKAMLEKSGYTVEIADNGKKGVERVKKSRFGVILMDIYMPVMDGLEATERIREWERANHKEPTAIIAVTAHAIEGYREKCLAHGMNDFIAKPIKKKKLIQAITPWFDRTQKSVEIS